jgi:hypothetical protein
MRKLDDEIALLLLRSEQLLIHLEQVPPNSPDAAAARKDIDGMTQRLMSLQRDRNRLRTQFRSTNGDFTSDHRGPNARTLQVQQHVGGRDR